jgi:hypothetical protein
MKPIMIPAAAPFFDPLFQNNAPRRVLIAQYYKRYQANGNQCVF